MKFSHQSNRPNILVVDDVADICEMIHTYITTFIDVNVYSCLDGMSALTQVRTKDFALIILDIDLPKMDGFQLAREITSIKLDDTPPIIYITGHVHDANRLATSYEIGAVDYITKPFNMEFLLSKVKVFLRLYEQRAILKNELVNQEKTLLKQKSEDDNFEVLFNTSQECICHLDIHGKILNINKSGFRLFKTFSETPLVGVHFSRWVTRADKQKFYQSLSEALGGKYSYHVISIQDTQNDIKWVEISLSPQMSNNEVVGIVLLAIDVTENRKTLESLNNELSLKIQELDKVKSVLAKKIENEKMNREKAKANRKKPSIRSKITKKKPLIKSKSKGKEHTKSTLLAAKKSKTKSIKIKSSVAKSNKLLSSK